MWEIYDLKEKKVIGKAPTLEEAEKVFNALAKEDPTLMDDERVEFQY